MKKNTILTPLLIITILAPLFAYYQYSLQQIPEKVVQSQKNIINVDTLDLNFKMSLLAQKSLTTYIAALKNQQEDQLNSAIDYLDNALAFTEIDYLKNTQFSVQAKQQLLQASTIIRTQKLTPTEEDIIKFTDLINQTSDLAKKFEHETSKDIQQNYIELKTNGYKEIKLYQILTLSFIGLLFISLWFSFKQRQLINLKDSNLNKLQRLAYIDPLTKIANRKNIENAIENKIKLCRRTKDSFYIALIDLDNFKNVNDLLGHSAGDELLKKCVNDFKRIIRQEDLIGRLGGDEFLILFNEHTDEHALIAVMSRIHACFAQPTQINDTMFNVTTSIGIANYPKDIGLAHDKDNKDNKDNKDDNDIMQNLIKSADIAMYQAKNLGKNQFAFFDEELESQIKLEHTMDKEIQTAIENDEFELYYQPQIDSISRRIIGAEALVRWNHPEKGLVMPVDFIGFIEKGYHTVEFGEWVVKTAAMQQKEWEKLDIPITISANLSVKHILSANFYLRMTHIIEELNIDLNGFIFEITEYELIKSKTVAIKDLNKLQEAGFRFYLDDFGTGYSSISYLSQLPIEGIKIDKSFIDYVQPNQEKKKLVDSIIQLGTTLNKKVIAEGVENKYQAYFLNESGCQAFQGYLFSESLPATEFEKFYAIHQRENTLL
ncbi:bifunctional diguanylate cyclase/phosphodiesterase [Thiomicrorhabdus sp. Milos-T2]|uniref:putative bifunctional diguanylate cyclase/phosphodiesterase n=1 Tax=Thiomicrorhabdus sp. Milos-T2 TaxID=90814 RepID=UPI00131A1821|nr:EAL domain-containing protein [Thiomicrorhabdus sp. Milos-T2]